MRCVACGTEMLLVKVTPDDTMIASGYERYTLQCLGCYEIEEHLIFNSARRSRAADPSAALSALSIAYVEADNELDKIETLLNDAIEMVRAPTARPRRTVRIAYEPHDEAAFAAKDTHTGQVVLRHKDSAHLRAMCNRLRWQVIGEVELVAEAGATNKGS